MTHEQALLQTIAELQMRINAMQQRIGQLTEENRTLAAQIPPPSDSPAEG